ncbi:MAG: OsmC family protein [Candidatus Lokiarchaeota archaeon]|nr:OsmC family protein [Candidatus Lokiarchaeota archaeon]
MRKKLVSDETLKAYKDRFEKMIKNLDTEEGDRLFISKVTAVSEQIDNMHVKASVGNYVLENDGPKDLGGSGKIPGPMQMLLASLANCLEITALLYLSLSNLNVNSINVKVEALYDKRSAYNPKKEPFPGFYNIKYVWYIDTDENLKKIDQILKKAEEVCPVKGTCNKHHEFPRKIKLIKKST